MIDWEARVLEDHAVRVKKSKFFRKSSNFCVSEIGLWQSFDLDYPLEVDDEYWVPSDPSQPAFVQPEGKPSTISFFVSMLKLTQIKAHCLRTLVSISFLLIPRTYLEKSHIVLHRQVKSAARTCKRRLAGTDRQSA